MNYSIPYFGSLNSTSLNHYYKVQVFLDTLLVDIDINFESKTTNQDTMDSLRRVIENIHLLDKKNKEYIENDYDNTNSEIVKLYLEHHLEELNVNYLSKELLKKLQLIRIGFYPQNDDSFVVFDYSIGRKITNYVISIYLNKNEELDYISMES